MNGYHYDYTEARRYVTETLGIAWLDDLVFAADEMFHEIGLTQAQVDRLMREYAWRIKWMFTPQNYGFMARVKLALHFLLGRHVTPKG